VAAIRGADDAIDHTIGWRIRKLPVRLENPEI
jgi:hypothetical protein